MVDVLTVSGGRGPKSGLAVTPTSEVSGAEIMAPYSAIAKAVGFLGNRLEEASLPYHRAAGAESVTLDENGMPRVQWRMEFTPGDEAHNAAARQTALAKGRLNLDQRFVEIRKTHESDPDGFLAAAGEVTKSLKQADPMLRPFLQDEAQRLGRQHFEAVAEQKERRDFQSLASAWKEEESLLRDKSLALAAQGGTQTKEFQELQVRLQDIRAQKTKHPKFAYGDAERAIDNERDAALFEGASIVGNIRRTAAKGGIAEAERLTKQLEESPTLRQEDKRFLVAQARDATRELNEERRIQRVEIRSRAQAVQQTLTRGAPVDDAAVDGLLAEASENGDVQSVVRLTQARALNKALRDFGGLSLAEKAGRLRTAGAGLITADTPSTVVDRIIGVESGGSATAKNPNSTATGAGQFIESTWIDVLTRNRPDLVTGKSRAEILALRNDATLSRAMTAAYTDENRQRLLEAGLPATAGNLYLSHFAGSGGARAILRSPSGESAAAVLSRASGGRTSPEKIVEANPFLTGMTAGELAAWADRKMGTAIAPGEGAALFNAYRTALHDDLKRQVPALVEGMAKGAMPSEADIGAVIEAVRITGDIDLGRKFAEGIGRAEGARAAEGATGPVQSAVLTQLEAAARDGSGLMERSFAEGFEKAAADLQTDLGRDWLGVVPRMSWMSPELKELAGHATAPLQFGAPAFLAAQLQERVALSKRVQERYGRAPGSLLRPTEVEALKGALATAEPPVVLGIFQALAGLEPEYLEATLRSGHLATAMGGLINTKDAGRYTAAMSGLDMLHARNRQVFAETFSEGTLKRLQTWQATLRYTTPADVPKALQKMEDGASVEYRRSMETEGRRLAQKVTPESIIGAWSAPLDPTGLTAPDVPEVRDFSGRDAFMADFRTLFVERFAETGDEELAKEQAIDRMRTVWAVSPANGNRLTMHAPERYFRDDKGHPLTINRSFDWLREDIQQTLRRRVGMNDDPVIMPDGNVAIGGPGANRSIRYQLVTTRRTEEDISAGRTPRYQLVYTDPNTGRIGAMQWPDEETGGVQGMVDRAMTPPRDRNAAITSQNQRNLRRERINEEVNQAIGLGFSTPLPPR